MNARQWSRLFIRTTDAADLWRLYDRLTARFADGQLDYRPGDAIVARAKDEDEAAELRLRTLEALDALRIVGTVEPPLEPEPPWSEDLRVVVRLCDAAEQTRAVDLLSVLPDWASVHTDGAEVGFYAPDRAHARAFARRARQRLREHHIECELEIQRWNWKDERWQDPALPVPRRPRERRFPHPDDCHWELTIVLPWENATGLREEAAARGFLAVAGDRTLRIAVPDEQALANARKWVDRLSPKWGVVQAEVSELNPLRHWQWRQWVFGNYGVGDPTSPGPG